MNKKWIALAPLGFLGLLAFIALGGWIVMSLWNWLMPVIFGWNTVTFWQALGLLLLCRILFGGFGRRLGRGPGWRRRRKGRCAGMTPEEKERFRQKVHERWGEPPSYPPQSSPNTNSA